MVKEGPPRAVLPLSRLLAVLAAVLVLAIAVLAPSSPLPATCLQWVSQASQRTAHILSLPFTFSHNGTSKRTTAASSSSRHVSRVVTKSVPAIQTTEGVGAIVRRSIGTPSLQNLSPFLMLDHFKIPLGAGFADHPHRGQVTITLMLEGEVLHEDFSQHAGTIGPGDLQWMTAGRGIVHAEMPRHFDEHGKRLPEPVGLQLWLDLPTENKFDEPDYQELNGSSLPTVHPRPSEPIETEGKGWTIKIIAGESHGAASPVRSPAAGGCWYFDITLQPGGRVFQPLPQGWNAFLYSTPARSKSERVRTSMSGTTPWFSPMADQIRTRTESGSNTLRPTRARRQRKLASSWSLANRSIKRSSRWGPSF